MSDDHKKKCPDCVLDVSVPLLHLRHAAEDRMNADQLLPHYKAVYAAIENSFQSMKELGTKKMQYADAMLTLRKSQTDDAIDRPWRIMSAHNILRKMLAEVGIAEPTDAEIIAHAKKMEPTNDTGNQRILGNFR
jgi:hypothetical protein